MISLILYLFAIFDESNGLQQLHGTKSKHLYYHRFRLSKSSFFPGKISKRNGRIFMSLRQNANHDFDATATTPNRSPFPELPSANFLNLASSQLELLSHSLLFRDSGASKVKSSVLYLPQENAMTGQLEFLPTVIHPNPLKERIFIASDAGSGVAPKIPPALTKLPGFANAKSVMPTYPFATKSYGESDAAGVGGVEEGDGGIVSCALFSGSRTVGVLLILPNTSANPSPETFWTAQDKSQISRAAYSLSLAFSMDTEAIASQTRTEQLRLALSENLHQVKNPIQALRTFGKLLQRKIALEEQLMRGEEWETGSSNSGAIILSLAENIMAQTDRVVDLMLPMDGIVRALDAAHPDEESVREKHYLNPSRKSNRSSFNMTENSSSEQEPLPMNDRALPNFVPENLDLEIAFVPDVIEPILSGCEAIAQERHIHFQILIRDEDDLPGASICPKALQEALANVIDNALKYVVWKQDANGKIIPNPVPFIKVIIKPNPQGYEPGVTILVTDNGPGIPQKDRQKIFERGYRADNVKDNVDGTGIGLDISSAFVRKMGGVLDVVDGDIDADVLNGTVIRFLLFRHPPHNPHSNM